MQAFPILQSGFVSFPNRDLQKDTPTEPTIRQEVIFKVKRNPLEKYHYSKEVSELFSRWVNNRNALKDFGFRERILKAAFSLFKNISFFEWLRFQNDKPMFSDLHRVYAIETLDYLTGRSPRKIENIQWIRLLEANEKTSGTRVDLDSYFIRNGQSEAIGPVCEIASSASNYGSAMNAKQLPMKLVDILQIWTAKERGFEDLLITLNVIFGSRSTITDVNELTI